MFFETENAHTSNLGINLELEYFFMTRWAIVHCQHVVKVGVPLLHIFVTGMVKIIMFARFFLLSAKNNALVILYWKDFFPSRLLFDIEAKQERSFVFSSLFLVNLITGCTPHLSTYEPEFLHRGFILDDTQKSIFVFEKFDDRSLFSTPDFFPI